MREIKLTRTVAAPPQRLWEVVTDLDSVSRHISGISRIERLDGGNGFEVGTRWRETRTMFGREATEEMEVTGLEPGRSYTVEADGRGAHYRSVFTVEPHPDGSRLTTTFAGQPRGALARVLAATIGRLFEGATRKALQRDLDEMAAAAER